MPHETDGPRAVQRLLLPAIVHIPAAYWSIPGALSSGVSVHDLFPNGIKSLIVTNCFFSFTGTVWHCPLPMSQQGQGGQEETPSHSYRN